MLLQKGRRGFRGRTDNTRGKDSLKFSLEFAFLLTEGIDLYLKMVYSIVCGEEPREWIAKGGIL